MLNKFLVLLKVISANSSISCFLHSLITLKTSTKYLGSLILGRGFNVLGVKYGASVSISNLSLGISLTIFCNSNPLTGSAIQPVMPM